MSKLGCFRYNGSMSQKGFTNVAVIIGIVVIVGIAGIAGSFVLNQRTTPSPAPTPTSTSPTSTSAAPTSTPITNPDSGAITVSLGREFTLKKGEIARVKDLNVFLEVKYFIYSPCPKGAQCFWSGLAVVYELTVDGKVYGSSLGNPLYEAPYDVIVKKTDYKTYATFVINKPSPASTPTPPPSGERIIKKVGEQEGSFLIQKINPDSVDGLWYEAYPVATTNQGYYPRISKTLRIGDDIGYACEGVSEKLTSINFSGQTVTFNKIVGTPPSGGCPI